MVTDKQVRCLMKLIQSESTLSLSASKSGMDEKTARKYRRLGRLPSELKQDHTWRTRKDPFQDVWDEIQSKLSLNPGLEAKTLFDDLQRCYPGRFSDGQLRTLQRRVKVWRAQKGHHKEVFFSQTYRPGERCQSDFTHMNSLNITIGGQPFSHMIYHFVLPYSNWETGTICYSESFESLSEGLQNALWELGGVPRYHQTDSLSTAVHKADHPETFTQRYQALLSHYRVEGRKTQAGHPHENGDIEQRHHRFKRSLEQSLLLRNSRDFETLEEYRAFLEMLFQQLNSGRQPRFAEELKSLRRLPPVRQDACKRLKVKVGRGSTIRVNHNVYSVDSRLIGEVVDVRLYVGTVEIWYAQRQVDILPRLRGESRHHIEYRHIIDWLVRKPGAFANYRYRSDLFPGSRFRIAYDALHSRHTSGSADKEYLKILHLAARENESAVDDAIRQLLDDDKMITFGAVSEIVATGVSVHVPTEVSIPDVDITVYDRLLSVPGVAS